MQEFAAPARPLVKGMTDAAAADPARAVAFQGAPGANSHVAALEAIPDGLPLPCFDFADACSGIGWAGPCPSPAILNSTSSMP